MNATIDPHRFLEIYAEQELPVPLILRLQAKITSSSGLRAGIAREFCVGQASAAEKELIGTDGEGCEEIVGAQ